MNAATELNAESAAELSRALLASPAEDLRLAGVRVLLAAGQRLLRGAEEEAPGLSASAPGDLEVALFAFFVFKILKSENNFFSACSVNRQKSRGSSCNG